MIYIIKSICFSRNYDKGIKITREKKELNSQTLSRLNSTEKQSWLRKEKQSSLVKLNPSFHIYHYGVRMAKISILK